MTSILYDSSGEVYVSRSVLEVSGISVTKTATAIAKAEKSRGTAETAENMRRRLRRGSMTMQQTNKQTVFTAASTMGITDPELFIMQKGR